MFIPTVSATITPCTGSFSASGQRVMGTPFTTKIGLVKLEHLIKKSAQDSDGSGSKNASEESMIIAKILLSPTESISRGDKVVVAGMSLRIETMWPDYDTSGRFDHWQCDCTEWA